MLRSYAPPSAVRLEPVTVRGRPLATGDRVRGPTVATPPLRKLLFSATLTSNPQKLAGLDVVNPLIYTARETTRRGGRAPDGAGALRAPGDSDLRARDGDQDDDSTKRPSQQTKRSNLDDVNDGSKVKGRFSTPATLLENYTVCDSQVRAEITPITRCGVIQKCTTRRLIRRSARADMSRADVSYTSSFVPFGCWKISSLLRCGLFRQLIVARRLSSLAVHVHAKHIRRSMCPDCREKCIGSYPAIQWVRAT